MRSVWPSSQVASWSSELSPSSSEPTRRVTRSAWHWEPSLRQGRSVAARGSDRVMGAVIRPILIVGHRQSLRYRPTSVAGGHQYLCERVHKVWARSGTTRPLHNLWRQIGDAGDFLAGGTGVRAGGLR